MSPIQSPNPLQGIGNFSRAERDNLPAPLEVKLDLGRIISGIEARATREQKSFFGMVPDQYKDHLQLISTKAYEAKGAGRNPGEFREAMAKSWLAKMEFFKLTCASLHFDSPLNISKDEPAPIMLLTMSGSLMRFWEQEPNGRRKMQYLRLEERESVGITGDIVNGALLADISVGKPCMSTVVLRTSPVIATLVARKPGHDMDSVSQTLCQSFIDIDHRTVHSQPKLGSK